MFLEHTDKIAAVQISQSTGMNMAVIAVTRDADADSLDVGIFFQKSIHQSLKAFVGYIVKPHHILIQTVPQQIVNSVEKIALAAGGRRKDTADMDKILIVNIACSRPSQLGGDISKKKNLPVFLKLVHDIAGGGKTQPCGLGDGMLREFCGILDNIPDQLNIAFFNLVYCTYFVHILHPSSH